MSPEAVDAGLVERAARAMDPGAFEFPEECAGDIECARDEARAAIAAVIPEIQAQALRDAADDLATCPGSCGDHRPATHRNDARTLRSIARRLTATTEEPT